VTVNEILKAVWDEFEPDHEWIEAPILPNVDYILVKGGVMILHRHKGRVEIHAAFLPEHRGKTAIKEAKRVLDYSREQYGEITAKIKLKRKNVKQFAQACGMTLFNIDDQYYWLRF